MAAKGAFVLQLFRAVDIAGTGRAEDSDCPARSRNVADAGVKVQRVQSRAIGLRGRVARKESETGDGASSTLAMGTVRMSDWR
jgi:hypothetical protein